MAQTMTIHLATTGNPLAQKAAEILRREIADRASVSVEDGDAEAMIFLDIHDSIGAEGFRISDGAAGQTVIAGADGCGLMAGVGKFLRTSHFGDGVFSPSSWRGESVPERPLRGIYFATHFHNVYHDGPVELIERYVESLALWGCNVLNVWFDMHHFSGIDDPEAQAMIARLRTVLGAANAVGIAASLLFLANEGYANSPEELRADWTCGHDGYHREPAGHYQREICPAKPGGMEEILRTREEMLDAFAGIEILSFGLWPYDQGGCTCGDCTPWGTNGYLKIAEALGPLLKRKHPEARVILSTWYFDHFIDGEWEGLGAAFADGVPEWLDYLLVDDNADQFPQYPLEHGAPGGLPMVSFPEISMYRMNPWGGYGANPMPTHFQDIWNQTDGILAGGFPYSEGIYEDINKAIELQLFWNGRDAWETVREYAAYEYGESAADEVIAAIRHIEAAQLADWHAEASSPDAQSILEEAEEKLTPFAKTQWRWRILKLRAEVDRELLANDGTLTEACRQAFEELVKIYHAQNTWVGNCTGRIPEPWNG